MREQNQPPTYYEEVSLMDYINVLWKRKWLIIIPTLFTAIIAGVVSFLLPPKWEVDTIILPSKFLVQTATGQFEEVLVVDPKQVAGQINQESYNRLIASKLNLDIRRFPKLKAENLRDTKLVRVSLRTKNVDEGKAILSNLFNLLKEDFDRKINVEVKSIDAEIETKRSLIREKEISIKDAENQIEMKRLLLKDKDNEIKARENDIKKKNNDIRVKDLEVQSKEIEKSRLLKEIEADQNKLKISEERVNSIHEEMRSVKARIDEIDEQMRKALAERKQGSDAISLLLYSNEVQQNLRYYNTLDEKLSAEKITQENLRLSIRDKQELLRQIDTQINQIKTQQDSIRAEIDTIMTEIARIKTEKDKIGTEIQSIKNEIEKIKNSIKVFENEIGLLQDRKARLDYAQLVKEPTSSLYPVSPRKRINILLGGMVGGFIFVMLAFFVDYLEKQKK